MTPLNGTLEEGELITKIDGRSRPTAVFHISEKSDCRVYDKRFMETSGTLENDVLTILSLGQGVQREPAKFVLKEEASLDVINLRLRKEQPGHLKSFHIFRRKKMERN